MFGEKEIKGEAILTVGKNREIILPKFTGVEDGDDILITPSLKKGFLYTMYGPEGIKRLSLQLTPDVKYRELRRFIYGNGAFLKVSNGIVRLPFTNERKNITFYKYMGIDENDKFVFDSVDHLERVEEGAKIYCLGIGRSLYLNTLKED